MTKSYVGTLAADLVAQGKLDREARVAAIIPELAQSGFGDATDWAGYGHDHSHRFRRSLHQSAIGHCPLRAGRRTCATRPVRAIRGLRAYGPFLATVAKKGEHGERFTYRTVNTDVLVMDR